MAKKAVARPQHKRKTLANKVRAIMKNMSQEDLCDINLLKGTLARARLKVSSSDIYRIRKEFLHGPVTNDMYKNLLLVQRTVDQVGGMVNFKAIVNVLEKVRTT